MDEPPSQLPHTSGRDELRQLPLPGPRALAILGAIVGPLLVLLAEHNISWSVNGLALVILAEAITGIVMRTCSARRLVVLGGCCSFFVMMVFADLMTVRYRDLGGPEREAWREAHRFPEQPSGNEIAALTGFPVRGIESSDDCFVLKEWSTGTVEDFWPVTYAVPWSRGFGVLLLNYCIFYAITLLLFAWLIRRGRHHDVSWLALCLSMIGYAFASHWAFQHGR